LLAHSRVHDAFVNFAHRGHREHGVATGRYVIMPDHLHVFVYLPETGCALVRWEGGLKRHLSTVVASEFGVGSVWQRGFFDHVLRSGESYSEKWEYVRMNPVRAGLCARSEDWPWQGELVPVRW
jgi:REP element-mobilizing transposase RayT